MHWEAIHGCGCDRRGSARGLASATRCSSASGRAASRSRSHWGVRVSPYSLSATSGTLSGPQAASTCRGPAALAKSVSQRAHRALMVEAEPILAGHEERGDPRGATARAASTRQTS
jgi:hypothetical protein